MATHPKHDTQHTEDAAGPSDAWRRFCRRLEAAGDAILADGFPSTERDRAEGLRWLTRLMTYATRMQIEAGDPRFPRFVRYETPDMQWGGPNPDNDYLRARVDPQHAYRISADVRGVRQAIFSLHDGDMQEGHYGVFGETSLDALEISDDGRLEIVLSRDRRPGNWIELHSDARLFGIRVFTSDWVNDASPVFHIERIGAEGVPPPPLDAPRMIDALDRAASWVEASSGYWNAYTAAGWQRSTANAPSAPTPAKGGADHILYGSCFFELARDEALILECAVPDADYYGFTIHTLGWLESGDFAERQTSLSDRQMYIDDDARMRVVLSADDPGCPNWIDTEGRERGLLVYRFVWSRDAPVPTAHVTRRDDVRAALPGNHPHVDALERRRRLSQRREAAWNRFQ